MARYSVMNPGKYHLGTPFTFPPLQNRTYNEKFIIKDIKWKTSVLLNRRMYLGNVQIRDVNNTVKVLSDSILKSKTNKFDSFTLDRRIDVAIGDGDEIIKLATFADRLLQFKQNILHIINATRSTEFLEQSYKFKGVSHASAVCTTEYGVAWCNSHGACMYDGERVQELLVREGVRLISDEDWSNFYVEGETMVSYVPKTKQLLFIRGNNSSTDNIGNVMIYNLALRSWTRGTGRLDEADKSNLINIWDGRPSWARAEGGSVTIFPRDPNAAALINNFKIETKEMNFGTQTKKKIIKLNLTYKGGSSGNTNVLPKYAVDNGGFSNSFKDSSGTTITNIPYSSDWAEISLYTDSSNAGSVRSFALQLTDVSGANVVSDFEINDMTVIYRRKSIK